MKHLRIMKWTAFFKGFTLAALLVTTAHVSLAQDADALLSRLSEEAKGYGSIEATYTSKLIDRASDFESVQQGSIQIDGDQFHLDLGDYQIFSDGVTIWTYEVAVNDCYIEDAETMAEEGMDPSKLFTIWEDDFKNEWKGELKVNGQLVTHINLYPSGEKEKAFHTIQLYIDETNLRLVRAVVKGREGTDVTYDVETFQSKAIFKSGLFKFDATQFPGVNLIDNRI
jgi:outer membrane lipoprotein-sorting protein